MRIYVGSPFRGEQLANIAYARECCRELIYLGHHPLALHLHDTQFLDDGIDEERALGMKNGKAWLDICDCAIFFLDRGLSRGMIDEIEYCNRHDIQYYYTHIGDVVDTVQGAMLQLYVKELDRE